MSVREFGGIRLSEFSWLKTGDAKMMGMMNGGGMSWMMGGMGLVWILVLALLFLGIVALIKYLRS